MDFKFWDQLSNARDLAEKDVEVWMPVPLSPARYRVSNLGRVASQTRNRPWQLLNIRAKLNKYPIIGIYVNEGDKRPKGMLLHRLVLLAFDGEPAEGKTDGRHLNGNGHDARLCNLMWGTRSENMKDLWEHRGLQVDALLPPPEPNKTYSIDPKVVQRGIRLFEAGKLSLKDLSELWACSRGVARRALVGETWEHLERGMTKIEQHLGRTGDKHHKSTISDDQLKEALRLYTEEKWSGVRFADFLDIPQITAHSILSGRVRMNVGRPEGFQYPWPGAAGRWAKSGSDHPKAKLTEEQVAALFDRIVAGDFETVADVAKEVGLSKSPIRNILSGKTWQTVSRPEGFDEAVARMKAAGNKARGTKNVVSPADTQK